MISEKYPPNPPQGNMSDFMNNLWINYVFGGKKSIFLQYILFFSNKTSRRDEQKWINLP